MKRGLHLVLLFPVATLVGCGLPSNPASGMIVNGAWTNWQIQAGTTITSPPPSTNLYLTGAVQVQGSVASAIFTIPTQTGTQVVDCTGTFGPSTQSVMLLSNAYDVGFNEPSAPYTMVAVNVTGGCVGVAPVCNAIFEVPSVGVQIADLTGTYSGTLTDSATPSMSGTATLTLTQAATPNSSGQFPLSGTIAFPSGSGLATAALGGSIAGEGVALSASSAAPNSPSINLTASAAPTGSQITLSQLTYTSGGTAIVYTGTLNRQ